MKIASWNVNSIRARLEPALAWLNQAKPDVVCLQEIKCLDENFPREPFEALGYNCAVHGQKSYNGVAILSKRPLEDITPRLPGGEGDDHSRYLEAVVTGGGCSGYSYNFALDETRLDDDLLLVEGGAKILIDPVSLDFLAGAEIDFGGDLMGQAFKVNNPNATSSCGCGTSFSV